MNTAHAKLIVQNYSESRLCKSELTYYELLGAIGASLCHSEQDFDIELLPFLTGHMDAYFVEFQSHSEIPDHFYTAVTQLKSHYYELFEQEKFSLFEECNQAENELEPNLNLIEWCDGFLKFYCEIEECWQDDFDFLAEVDDSDELCTVLAEHDASLDLLTTLTSWQQTLAENPDKTELLQNTLPELIKVGSASICQMFKLAVLFQNMKLETMVDEFEAEVEMLEALDKSLSSDENPDDNVIKADFKKRRLIKTQNDRED